MRLLIWTLAVVLLSACEKRTDTFVFDCTVYDQRLDMPVPGASVVMWVQRVNGGFNPNFEQVGATVTDAEGRFHLEVEKEVVFSFRVDVSHPDHFSTSFSIDPDHVPFSTAYSETFDLAPKAWVATHLVNQNMSTTATFKILSDNGDCTECCAADNHIVQGFPIDSLLVCPVYGEQEVTVSGTYVDQNGAVHQILRSAYVHAFDTTTVTVVY